MYAIRSYYGSKPSFESRSHSIIKYNRSDTGSDMKTKTLLPILTLIGSLAIAQAQSSFTVSLDGAQSYNFV